MKKNIVLFLIIFVGCLSLSSSVMAACPAGQTSTWASDCYTIPSFGAWCLNAPWSWCWTPGRTCVDTACYSTQPPTPCTSGVQCDVNKNSACLRLGTDATCHCMDTSLASTHYTGSLFGNPYNNAVFVDCAVTVTTGTAPGVCGNNSLHTFPIGTPFNTVSNCSVGTSSPIVGTGPWSWNCAGPGGGATVHCSAAVGPGEPAPAPPGTASARTTTLEITYPNLFGAPAGGPQTGRIPNLTTYISYIYLFFVVISGIIAVITIVYYGTAVLFGAAMGNASAVGNARERILDCILGIVLLMVSTIILNTINPDLIQTTNQPRQMTTGVWLFRPGFVDPVHPNGDFITASNATINTATLNQNYSKLVYYCSSPGPNILVWAYDKTGFSFDRGKNATGALNVNTWTLHCGNIVDLTTTWNDPNSIISDPNDTSYLRLYDNPNKVLSFSYERTHSGVYYYLTPNCKGISTCYTADGSCAQESDSRIPRFDQTDESQRPMSMKIVNSDVNLFRYGVILKNDDNMCSGPMFGDDVNIPPPYPPSSVY